MSSDRSTKRRRKLARAIELALVPERPFRHGQPYIVHPDIALVCTPSLVTIAATLRDQTRRVEDHVLQQVDVFICDGASPFFGRDTIDALREVVRLQHLVVNGTPPRSSGRPRERRLLGTVGSARKAVLAAIVANGWRSACPGVAALEWAVVE